MMNPNTSSERVAQLERLSDRIYDAIDQPVQGEPRYRAMLRLCINLIGTQLNRNMPIEHIGELVLATVKDQFERGGLTYHDAAYAPYANYRRLAARLPKAPVITTGDLDTVAHQYADTTRATIDRDGALETNARHAIHLLGFAVPYAMELYPSLHPGTIAVHSINHDMPEAITGDRNTFGMSLKAYQEKVDDEQVGMPKLAALIGNRHKALFATVLDYEAQEEPEAQYVRHADKFDPYFAHFHDRAAHLVQTQPIQTVDDFLRLVDLSTQRIATYKGDFALLRQDRNEMTRRLAEIGDWPQKEQPA